MSSLFKGSLPALVTPFKDGKVDEKAFRAHVSWVIDEGSHGIVPVGTTGESPTLTHDEHKRVVEWAIEEARGRVPVMAGAGSNNTAEAIDFSRHAEKAGAQGLLHVTPYYNKPSQEGLYRHFKAIAEATSHADLHLQHPAALGGGDERRDHGAARRDPEHRRRQGCDDEARPRLGAAPGLRQGLHPALRRGRHGARPHMAHGGHGCISVTANVAPRLCAEFQNACLAGNYAKALEIQDKLFPLHQALFVEPNPAPSKAALALLGRMADEVRLPMVPASAATRETLKKAWSTPG